MEASLIGIKIFYREIRFGGEGVEAGLVGSWELVRRDMLEKKMEGIEGSECR